MTEKFIAHSFGILYTGEGNSYYLLKDIPFDRYPWQNDNQQMWYVVKREWRSDESNDLDQYRPVGYAFRLVTSNPTIEFVEEEIEVLRVSTDADEDLAMNYVGLPMFDDEYVPDMQID